MIAAHVGCGRRRGVTRVRAADNFSPDAVAVRENLPLIGISIDHRRAEGGREKIAHREIGRRTDEVSTGGGNHRAAVGGLGALRAAGRGCGDGIDIIAAADGSRVGVIRGDAAADGRAIRAAVQFPINVVAGRAAHGIPFHRHRAATGRGDDKVRRRRGWRRAVAQRKVGRSRQADARRGVVGRGEGS